MVYQLFVKGFKAYMLSSTKIPEFNDKITFKKFKEILRENIDGLSDNSYRTGIIFGSRDISNVDESITLSELGLRDCSTIFILVRMGGPSGEKCDYCF